MNTQSGIAPQPDFTLVRFVLPGMTPDTGVSDGVFHAAYNLKRGSDLSSSERKELESLLQWFGKNLEVPTRFNRTKSKGYTRRTTKGISWLKSTATEHIANMHSMVSILRNYGHHVTMIKTKKPGYVVYEDEHQIVAEPFNDLRT